MGSSEFESSWKRIKRSQEHRSAVTKAWNDFIDGEEPYSPNVYVEDGGTGSIVIESRYFDRSLADTALQIGEMLYQLRAALDACIYSAAVLETGQDPPPNKNALEFPVCPSAADFQKYAWKLGPLKEERRRIVELVQPYNAPELTDDLIVFNYNRALSILHDWARIDRHRRLHVIGTWVVDSYPEIRVSGGATLASLLVCNSAFLEGDNEIAVFTLRGWKPDAGMKVSVNPHAFLDIALSELPMPCHPKDSFSNRCEAMFRAVAQVIFLFEKSFGLAKISSDVE